MTTSDIAATRELPPCDGPVDRRRYLPARATGARVVHLGCVDEGHFEARWSGGDLLHAQLAEVAAELVGVDLSEAGTARLAERVPGAYLVGDVEELGRIGLPESCDLVIAGELIEHLPNPGRFLDELRAYLATSGATAILTTPNAYAWMGFARFAIGRREPTHPDHLLIYSPTTLVRVLEHAGLEVVAFHGHRWEVGRGLRQRLRGLLDSALLRWNPWLAVGLVVEVRPDPSAAPSGR